MSAGLGHDHRIGWTPFVRVAPDPGDGKFILIWQREPGAGLGAIFALRFAPAGHGDQAAALREAGAKKVLMAGRTKELGDDQGVVDGSLYDGMDVVAFLSDLLDDLGVAR